MPFVLESVKDKIKELQANDPEFVKAYEIAKQERQVIGKIIRARKKIGLTQGDIAKKLGMKQQAISTFERVSDSPSLKKFLQYANALGLEVRVVKRRKLPERITVAHSFQERSISKKRTMDETRHVTSKS